MVREHGPLRVGILMSRVRVEEKLLLAELDRRGVEIVRFDDRVYTLRCCAGALYQSLASLVHVADAQVGS